MKSITALVVNFHTVCYTDNSRTDIFVRNNFVQLLFWVCESLFNIFALTNQIVFFSLGNINPGFWSMHRIPVEWTTERSKHGTHILVNMLIIEDNNFLVFSIHWPKQDFVWIPLFERLFHTQLHLNLVIDIFRNQEGAVW